MSRTAYDVAQALDAAYRRHPGLDWAIAPHLDQPYLIERRSCGSPTIYLHGASPVALALSALMTAIAELDHRGDTGPLPRVVSAG